MSATTEITTEVAEQELAQELKLETEYAYQAALEAVAEATELVQHAADLHTRSKAGIRASLRSGGPLSFVDDLAPNIPTRIREDVEVRELIRAHQNALGNW